MFKIFNKSNNQNYINFLANHSPTAIAYIKGNKDFPNIDGKVEFFETSSGVLVLSSIKNLPTNLNNGDFFAMHIHNGDNCNEDASGNFNDSTHFDKNNNSHPKHSGDFPNLLSNNGFAFSIFLTNRFNVNDVIGKTVFIHANADDGRSDPNGNSGRKIACGKILKRY